jgi:DNA-binding NtrC family response regulator
LAPLGTLLAAGGEGVDLFALYRSHTCLQNEEENMERSRVQSTFGPEGLVAGNLKESVRTYERALIIDALKVNGNDKRKVAKLLGISLSSLYRKLRELSIEGFEDTEKREAEREGAEVHTAAT